MAQTDLPLRRTKIVCTVGPSCSDKTTLYSLAEHGMNVARLNLSHGAREDHMKTIDMLRKYNATHAQPVAIMLDTRGAEIRTGDVGEPIQIREGDEVVFHTSPPEASGRTFIEVGYDDFGKDVQETDRILIDNGELAFQILSIERDGSVRARAKDSGTIGSRRHINLPGADIDLPAITEKDWEDIEFSANQNIDFVALSFIRSAEEVAEVRSLLEKLGSRTSIVTKMETAQCTENITSIIDVSDAIMVARGDLGAEIPFEDVPVVQDEIVMRCRDAGKPVIVATQMLESMRRFPMPTRAEVSDVAHAVTTGADATMLSGETAAGLHPLKALEAMVRIERRIESHLARFKTPYETHFRDRYEEEMDSAVALAERENADAFILLTDTGRTARNMSKFRPNIPIIALVNDGAVQKSLALNYAVYPLRIAFDASDDISMEKGIALGKKEKLLREGQKIIVLKNRSKEPEVKVL